MQRGLKFTGHLCSVSFREAVALGIDNLEHGLFTNSDYVPNRTPDHCSPDMRTAILKVSMDGPEVQQTIRDMVTNKVAMSSTLAVYELSYPDRPPLEDRVLAALSPSLRDFTIPKSSTLSVVAPPADARNRLLGFTSRCTRPARCAQSNPMAACVA